MRAIMNWTSQALGSVPAMSLPIAMQTGLIVMLGDWKREAVCQQQLSLGAGGRSVPRLSMRISRNWNCSSPTWWTSCAKTFGQRPSKAQALGIEISEQALFKCIA